jgi:predicted CXXCH cytochrome family protein
MIVDRQGPVCLSCHPDLEEALAKSKSKHAPVLNGECTNCHDAHKAKLPHLLLAKSADLCQTCHKDLKARMEKEKAHSPALRDCQRCHQPHFSTEPDLVVQKINTLCGECHDVKAPSFNKAHLSIEASLMDCGKCHDPHASKDPKFFKSDIHPPFASRSCEDCHIAEQR